MKNIALVANPCSGRMKTGRLLPKIKKMLAAEGIFANIFLSQNGTHIRTLASAMDPYQYDAIVCLGGDGTNFHLINGLLETHKAKDLPPLGIIPAGSGNSFARDLGIQSLEQAIRAIATLTPRPVNLLRYTGGVDRFYFINLMGLGFVTDVAVTAQKFKCLNDLSYLIGVARQTISLSCDPMQITVDDRTFSGRFCFVEFCNSRFTGGRMLMAPRARIDDGLMDVVMVRALSRKNLLTSLPKIYTGQHLSMTQTLYVQGKTARITTPKGPKPLLPDGEVIGKSPGTIEVVPARLRYLA